MGLMHTVESKLSTKYFLISVWVVNACLLNIFCSKTLEDTCLAGCICNSVSVTCRSLELKEIPTTTVAENVTLFDLSHNMLTHLKDFVFKEYRILESVYLYENVICSVDSRAFYGLANLKKIDLSGNNLQFINSFIFSDNPALQVVSLKRNPLLHYQDSSAILASRSITSLDLSGCSLTSVHLQTFSQLPNLRILNLNSNYLREFNPDILNTLTEIRNVDLGNNKWKCDCNIVEVLNLLSKKRKYRGLEGEHKPVKCFDAGVYKTVWMEASKNESCTEQSRNSSETITSTGPTTILGSTKTQPKNLQMKERTEDVSTLESEKNEVLSCNKNLPFFIILLLVLCVTVLVASLAVKFISSCTNSRRRVSMTGPFDSKTAISSNIPLISTAISSDSSSEDHTSCLLENIGSVPYTNGVNHVYEEII